MRGAATEHAHPLVPDNWDCLISKVLTTSDAKEHRIVLPKLRCEEVLVNEGRACNASPARDVILMIWTGGQYATDERPDLPSARDQPPAMPHAVATCLAPSLVPVATASAPSAAVEHAKPEAYAPAVEAAAESAAHAAAAPAILVPATVVPATVVSAPVVPATVVPAVMATVTVASVAPPVKMKFWSFRYRISPCGKSFIHTLHDQEGVLASLGALEGDRVLLCRRKIDRMLVLLVSRAPRRPPRQPGAGGTGSSVPRAVAIARPLSPPPHLTGRHQRRRFAPTVYAPNGLPPIGANSTPWPQRSPQPKRALKLFPNARIRVGHAFQAALPPPMDSPAAMGAPGSAAATAAAAATDEADDVRMGTASVEPMRELAGSGAMGVDEKPPLFASWTAADHERFSLALSSCGKDMAAIARVTGLRTQEAVEYYYYRKSHALVPEGPVPSFVTEPGPFS